MAAGEDPSGRGGAVRRGEEGESVRRAGEDESVYRAEEGEAVRRAGEGCTQRADSRRLSCGTCSRSAASSASQDPSGKARSTR